MDSNQLIMPVAPTGYGFGGNMGGLGWGSDIWLILIVLFAMGGFGGFGMGGFGGFGGMYEFPWLLNGQQGINANTNNGFDHLATQNAISGLQSAVTSGFGDVNLGIAGLSQQVCQTGNGITAAVTGAQNAVSQQLYNNEIANLNRSFAEQTANVQGFNTVNSGISDVRYAIASEACDTRNTDTQNTQAILDAINSGFRAMSDQRYQDKIDAKNDEIAQLRQEALYARGQASQVAQNSAIIDGVYNRFSACPVNTVPVFGSQPIFSCNNGCGYNNYGFMG